MATEAPAPEPMEVEVKPFEPLSILKLTKDAQQKHGLRHGNYKRYGDYCDRRIRRLRRALKFTHQYKCTPKHRGKFVAKPISVETVKDPRFLELAVFHVEHSWARGMEFKVASEDEKHARQIFHARRRLVRAAKRSDTLASIVEGCTQVDNFTKVEGNAYISFVCGSAALEKKDWKVALDHYIISRNTYQKLLKMKAKKDTELVQLYDQKVKELSNLIKLCEYHAAEKGVHVAPDVSQLQLDETSTADTVSEKEVSEKEKKKAEIKKKKESAPLPKPIPAKPAFFDLALKHFTFPDEIHAIATQPVTQEQQQAGLGGMVRNLLWGGKK